MSAATAPALRGYHINLPIPDDRTVPRDRSERWATIGLTSSLILLGPAAIAGAMSEMAFGTPTWGVFAGLAGGVWGLSKIAHRFVVTNREWESFITYDVLAGKMVLYGPGFHPAKPWETRSKRNNFPLTVATKKFSVTVQSKTSQVTAEGVFSYAINPVRLDRARGVEESTVQDGIAAFIESALTGHFAGETVEKILTSEDEANEYLAELFTDLEERDDRKVYGYGDKYGYITVAVFVSKFVLPPAVQKTRDAVDEAVTLHKVVAALYGYTPAVLAKSLKNGTLSHEQYMRMLRQALTVSDNAKMDIRIFEADLPAAVDAIAKRLNVTLT